MKPAEAIEYPIPACRIYVYLFTTLCFRRLDISNCFRNEFYRSLFLYENKVMRVRWQCNCSTDKLNISSLNFCSKCHSLSCVNCQLFEPVVKYCPQCLNVPLHNNQLTCHKNCFECPRCNLPLQIKMLELDSRSSKYILQCAGCDWSYTSPQVTRTESLINCIQSERETKDTVLERYRALEEHLNVKGLFIKCESSPHLTDALSNASIAQRKYVLQRLATKKLYELISEELPAKYETIKHSTELPLPSRLRCKYQYSCPKCRSCLLRPDANPRSSKIVTSSFAVDFLPNIRVLPLQQVLPTECDTNKLALVVLGPHIQGSMEIKISGSSGLYIPITEITVSYSKIVIEEEGRSISHRMELFATTIPTYQLKADTRLSRKERTRRLGKSSSQLYSLGNNKSSNSLIENSKIIDQGNGWCIIPLILLKDEPKHILQFKLAFSSYKIMLHYILEK